MRPTSRRSVFIALAAVTTVALGGCARVPEGDPVAAGAGGKVVVFGLQAITAEDLRASGSSFLTELLPKAAVGNISIRISNLATDGYAGLGAGQRTQTDPSAGWVFMSDEAVENGDGHDLHRRRGGSASSSGALVATMDQIRRYNDESGFEARIGALGSFLAAKGRTTAIIGNADQSLGPLPTRLPSPRRMALKGAPDPGIHREAALAAVDEVGRVARGDVSRQLLMASPGSPFGVATDPAAVRDVFREVITDSDMVVIETGDTARADAYTLGLSKEQRERIRRLALRRVLDEVVRPIVEELDPSALVILMAPNSPGGPEERGQLRPVVISGGGVRAGILTSASTRRSGVVTLADVSATIVSHLEASSGKFVTGRSVDVIEGEADLEKLVERNTRAVVHDWARARFAVVVNGLQLILFLLVVWLMRTGRLIKPWVRFLLVASLAFPVASFITVLGVWRLGRAAVGLTAFLAIFLIAWICWVTARADPMRASAIILGATFMFFAVDLGLGGGAQLDSILGYTSVGAGRFFGLGNLPFAIFSTSALLFAGMVADRLESSTPWIPALIVGVALLWIAHPSLGNDVGGTIAMLAAGTAFLFILLGPARKIPVLIVALGAAAAVTALALLDFVRPEANRTHLGDFLRGLVTDPASQWPVVSRKATIALDLAISTRWGLMLPVTAAILIWLHKRSRGRWRVLMAQRVGLRAGLDAAIVAAVAGSLANDSGIAVGGMMLAMAVPWALVVAAEGAPHEA